MPGRLIRAMRASATQIPRYAGRSSVSYQAINLAMVDIHPLLAL